MEDNKITIKGVTYVIDPTVGDIEDCAIETGVNWMGGVDLKGKKPVELARVFCFLLTPRPTVEETRAFPFKDLSRLMIAITKHFGSDDEPQPQTGGDEPRPSLGPTSGLVC